MDLAALSELVEAHVKAILDAARTAPPGGGHAWDQVLAFYGITPDPPAARLAEVKRSEIGSGALPFEVRRALMAMASRASAELLRRPWSADDQSQRGLLERRLARVADEEGARYEASARPRQTASVFANALHSSKQVPWAKAAPEPTLVLSCRACGAPQESALDFKCRYCHAEMG